MKTPNHYDKFTENGPTYISAQPADCPHCLRPRVDGHHGCYCDPEEPEETPS